jgi:hypothetical protein
MKYLKPIACALTVFYFSFFIGKLNRKLDSAIKILAKEEVKYIETPVRPLTDWQIFTLALIETESENNQYAVGSRNDGGILQITPVYIKEVNRIQSDCVYKLEDRFDIQKSLEMFNILNSFHNSELNIEKAILLHNPKAPKSYKAKIIKRINEIKKRELIRKNVLNKSI